MNFIAARVALFSSLMIDVNPHKPTLGFEAADLLNVFVVRKSVSDLRQFTDRLDESVGPGLKTFAASQMPGQGFVLFRAKGRNFTRSSLVGSLERIKPVIRGMTTEQHQSAQISATGNEFFKFLVMILLQGFFQIQLFFYSRAPGRLF